MGYTLLDEEGKPAKGAYTLLPDDAPPPAKAKPFGQQLNDAISAAPRQLGLTARYGIEGVGDMLDTLSSPIRAGLNAILPNKQRGVADVITEANARPAIEGRSGQVLANALGLPQPQTSTERVVGDAARMLAGGIVPIGAGAAIAKNTTGVAQGVGRMLAANPVQQLASAGAAGAAGGYTRETGGDNTSQMVASLAAGLAAPATVNAASRGVQAARGIAQRVSGASAASPQQIEITINSALQDSGMRLADLPADVARSIRADVAKAYQMGDRLSPDAVRRLADYRLVGATPTAAKITQDPVAITQQENLSKLGANSKDVAAQQLARTRYGNNSVLIDGVNALGGATADDAIAGGSKIMGALGARDARAKDIIGSFYDQARAANGRAAALDPHAFTQQANNLLDEALLGGKLPGDVRNLLNKAATGEMPLTVDVAEQFKTRIGDLQRASSDAAERKALGLVRSALDDTPLMPGQEIGREAINAFNKARMVNRRWMGVVEKTPALQAVRDGIEPDKFVQQFIIGSGAKSNVMDVAMLKNSIKTSPEAMDAVKTQITSFLKQKALNGAADEVGNFSQSAYNKALQAVGDRKLKLFFSQQEIDQLKAIGRVASYEQFQPVGSAVNNSNTAPTAMANILDRVGNSSLLSKVPFGRLLAEPAQNIAIGMKSANSLDAPRALVTAPRAPVSLLGGGALGVSPAVLAQPETEEERRKRLLLTRP
jgi:hypothetical protein